jgi:hypothetical protein
VTDAKRRKLTLAYEKCNAGYNRQENIFPERPNIEIVAIDKGSCLNCDFKLLRLYKDIV